MVNEQISLSAHRSLSEGSDVCLLIRVILWNGLVYGKTYAMTLSRVDYRLLDRPRVFIIRQCILSSQEKESIVEQRLGYACF